MLNFHAGSLGPPADVAAEDLRGMGGSRTAADSKFVWAGTPVRTLQQLKAWIKKKKSKEPTLFLQIPDLADSSVDKK